MVDRMTKGEIKNSTTLKDQNFIYYCQENLKVGK
jgi:hypothetical protein